METSPLYSIVFLCVLCSTHITSVHSQSSTDAPSPTSTPQTETPAPTDPTQTDPVTPDTPTPAPSTDSQPQTTDESTPSPPDGTTAAAPDGSSTAAGSTDQTTQDQSAFTPTATVTATATATATVTAPPDVTETTAAGGDNSTEGPDVPTSTGADNDTQSTAPVTPDSQTKDTGSTPSPDGSTPAGDNATSTQTPGGSTPVGDNSTTTQSPDASTPAGSTPANDTSEAPSSPASVPPTQPPSTAASTTSAPGETTRPPLSTNYPPVQADTDIATYTLELKFEEPGCNRSYLRDQLDDKLKTTAGYKAVAAKNDKQFDATFSAKPLVERDANSVQGELTQALNGTSDCYTYNETDLDDAISTFAAQTSDYCNADYICRLGYECRLEDAGPVCVSLCEESDCQNEAECIVVVNNKDGTARAQCRCVDTIGTVYSGEQCEVSRMNPERVAAIVGGVLGAVCFILLIALYCTCYRRRDNSGKKYHLSGVYNETYDHASLDMKNM